MDIVIGETTKVLAMAFSLAMVVERVTEFVIRPLLANAMKAAGKDEAKVGLVIPYITAIFGGLLSWGFGLDLFAGLAANAGLEPASWLTLLLTAVVAGGGSNLLHDLWPGSGGAPEPLGS